MQRIRVIVATFSLGMFFLIGCTLGSVLTSEEANTSDIHVYIRSDLKKLYVSVPKESSSIKVCFSKECKDEDKKEFSKPKEVDQRNIFAVLSTQTLEEFSIERIAEDNSTVERKLSLIEGNNSSENKDDKYAPNPEGVELTKDELSMIVAVNKYREQSGRSILKVCKDLMEGARQQSKLMFSYGQKHWLYPYNGATFENIYYWPRDLDTAMNGFKKSPGHNANMLNQAHTGIGIGAIIPETGNGSWTQRFK